MASKVSLRRVAGAVTATLMLAGSALVGAPLAGADPGPDPCPCKVDDAARGRRLRGTQGRSAAAATAGARHPARR